MEIIKSERLNNLSYAIRGPIFDKALEMERQGETILKLNIGNPAPFGFDVPQTMMQAFKENLKKGEGYSHHLGVMEVREAIVKDYESRGFKDLRPEEVFVGNGVSELIIMCMQALLNAGDEVLVPAPDYPLWTAAVGFGGGKAVHYVCDEQNEWNPDVADMERKITAKTKAIVIINPNNPTGAVYKKEILLQIVALAEKHNLVLFSDEIYDKILYDERQHIPVATLSDQVHFITFGGLSKNYFACGFRGGWMIPSGKRSRSFLEGMNLLASMRLCPNVPTQYTIATALADDSIVKGMIKPGGRLYEQAQLIHDKVSAIPGVSAVAPKGSLYTFPKIDLSQFNIEDDVAFTYGLLTEQKVLVIAGSGFNFIDKAHFRIVFLPEVSVLADAADRIAEFLDSRRK
jgi:alanine-synthesizing transaminase